VYDLETLEREQVFDLEIENNMITAIVPTGDNMLLCTH